MPSHSSFNKLFIYLTGLMVTCCLHLSCQFLSKLGMHEQDTSVLEDNKSNKTTDKQFKGIDINAIEIAIAGCPKKSINCQKKPSFNIDKNKDESAGLVQNYLDPTSFTLGEDTNGRVHVFGHDVCAVKYSCTTQKGPILLIGLGDGVGRKFETAPHMRAARICKSIMEAFEKSKDAGNLDVNHLKTMFNDAHLAIEKPGPRATTFCLIGIDGHSLTCLNVGDSRMVLVRKGKIEQRTKPQQSSFNCPSTLGDHKESKSPEDADQIEDKAESGDIVVVSSDSLFDNLTEEEYIDSLKEGSSIEEIAQNLLEKVRNNMNDQNKEVPFTKQAHKAYKEYQEYTAIKKEYEDRKNKDSKSLPQKCYIEQYKGQDMEYHLKYIEDPTYYLNINPTGYASILSRLQNRTGGKQDDISIIVIRIK